MNINKLIRLRDLKADLDTSTSFERWIKEQSSADQKAVQSLLSDLDSSINKLYHTELSIIADKLDELAPSLNLAIKELQDEIKKMENFIKVTETLGKVIGLISRVVSLVAGPVTPLVRSAVGSPFVTLEERTTISSAEKMSHRVDPSIVEYLMQAPPPEEDTVDGPPKSKPVAPVPVEEVLHGIELTDEKLIITVATGGCTKKSDFHIEVKPRYTYSSPYLVTVYRIKSDDCKGLFEPIRISFSRKKLGLEGSVVLHVLNRIGNTSQHRLLP